MESIEALKEKADPYFVGFSETPKEKDLGSREKEKGDLLDGGKNETVFLKLKDDGSAIFKSKNGECPGLRKNLEPGTYYKRERAAYLVDKFFAFNLVPPTVIREVDGELGSVQEFISDAEVAANFPHNQIINMVLPDNMLKMHLFDILIWNSDRHDGNFLLKEGVGLRGLVAIDHGLSFGKTLLILYAEYDEKTKRQKFPEIFGAKISAALQQELNKVAAPDTNFDFLKTLLAELLSAEDVARFFRRLEVIKKWVSKGEIPQEREFMEDLDLGYNTRKYLEELTGEKTHEIH